MRILFAVLLTGAALLGVISPSRAQQGEWRLHMKKDPIDDTFDSSLRASVDGVLLSMACGYHPNFGRNIAIAVIQAPINSADPSSMDYRIRFNGGVVEQRTAKYRRQQGTQEAATILLDDRDFDFILEHDIESIALELTDSIFGRKVVEYPAIPIEADEMKAFCIGKEKVASSVQPGQ